MAKAKKEPNTEQQYQIPDEENQCTTYCGAGGSIIKFVCTQKAVSRDRSEFTLYQLTNGKLKKLGKGDSPIELEKKHGISKDTL